MKNLWLILTGVLTTGTGLAAWFDIIPVNLGQLASFVWIIISIFIAHHQIKNKKLESAKLKEELLDLRIRNAVFLDEYNKRKRDDLPLRRNIDKAIETHRKEFPND